MARRHEVAFALNAGGVDKEALSRVDLEKMRLAGEHPVSNFLVRVLGPMILRPGMESLSRVDGDPEQRNIPFLSDEDDEPNYLLKAYPNTLLITQEGVPVTVSNSASTITNPTFTNGGGGWTDVSDTGAGADGTAVLGVSGGLTLTATRWRSAATEQTITVASGDQATPHTIRIVVERGPVFLRIGTASGGEQVLSDIKLATGTHKLTVTPGAGTIYLRLRSEDAVARLVTSCQFEHTALGGAGNLTLPTPWGEDELRLLTFDQSNDVLFIGDGVHQQRRIEQRGTRSWGITLYQTRKGPLAYPSSTKITLTPSATTGNGTLTASLPYFRASHVGGLFELTHLSQSVVEELTAVNQTTEKITVVGLYSSSLTFNDRNFTYALDFSTGSFVGSIALERSTDVDGDVWSPVTTFGVHTGSATYNDQQSNLRAHYRFRVTSYTSGYATVTLTYSGGSKTGLVRITGYSSDTSVSYEVVSRLGGTAATSDWREPMWSDDLGWPRVPRLFDGRLFWFLKDLAFASVSDDYDNYDDNVEGDSGPIIRSVGTGAAKGVRWALDMQRLIAGTGGQEASIRSSSFDEPLTPTAFTVRNASTQGVANVPAVKIDRGAIYVQRSGRRLYEMLYSVETNDYTSSDVSRLNPGALESGVVALAVQRQPDTRVYIVLNSGVCCVLTYERDDKVVAFTQIETDGWIEDVAVLPNEDQDDVYFTVRRNSTERYTERMAKELDQKTQMGCALLDAYKVVTNTNAITGATHLANRTVSVWADGRRRSDVAIDSAGNGTLDNTYARVVYGIGYTASYKSVKLAHAAQLGTALEQQKIIRMAGLVLSNSCLDGVRIGRVDRNVVPVLSGLPDVIKGITRGPSQFFAHFDANPFPVPSEWDSDSRIYLQVDSREGPFTAQAIVFDIETAEAVSKPGRG